MVPGSSHHNFILLLIAEKARLLAEAKAAEDARRQAEIEAAAEAAAEAKRKRELEREAARQALQKVILVICIANSLLAHKQTQLVLLHSVAPGYLNTRFYGLCSDGKDC